MVAALGMEGLALRWFANRVTPLRPGLPGPISPKHADSLEVHVIADGVELRPVPVEPDGPVYRLNHTAALIWQKADGNNTVEQIAGLVAESFSVSKRRALNDTVRFLGSLSRAGLTFEVLG